MFFILGVIFGAVLVLLFTGTARIRIIRQQRDLRNFRLRSIFDSSDGAPFNYTYMSQEQAVNAMRKYAHAKNGDINNGETT